MAGKFGEFGELSVIRQTLTSQILAGTLKKQNVKSTREIVESPKFCMAILTICSNLIIFGLYQPYPRSFNLL